MFKGKNNYTNSIIVREQFKNLFYMTPLMLAVYFTTVDIQKWEFYEKTIKHLVSPLSVSEVDQKDGLERTALHWAAIRGGSLGSIISIISSIIIKQF